MRIKELNLKNFKRFTDLQIKNIPAEAKLVLLIGANGSGKSSVFDAFEWMRRSGEFQNSRIDLNTHYFKKDIKHDITCNLKTDNGKNFSWKGDENKGKTLPLDFFYGRPSLRIVPTIENVRYDENVIRFNTDAPNRFIEFDDKFNLDVSKYTNDINKAIRAPIFAGKQADTIQIFKNAILPFNEALERIFGNDPATTIRLVQFEDASPDKPTKLLFQKGGSEVNYDLLGHGEKQVVVILLNFVIRLPYFQDTIYYIDEMDGHLNTSLQYALLKEITENWIPENCQLWTASHSLGFIEYAKDTNQAVILDFDSLDFDQKQVIEPIPKQKESVFEIAIPRTSLIKILGNRKIVLCENKNYELYSLMGLDDFIFTDVQNSNSIFLKIKRDKTLVGLRDKDYLTDNEISKLTERFPNYKILRYYCFENYLYHPENLAQIKLIGFDKSVYEAEIRALKNQHRHALVLKISESRKAYEEFRDGGIKPDSDIAHISKALESDDFEMFYPYFSFKDYCGSLINKYKIDKREIKEKLVQTEWFIHKLQAVLN
jgi:AAA domain, putative AbiEii toxin, Type IV TA system